jgi:hypothetical protein
MLGARLRSAHRQATSARVALHFQTLPARKALMNGRNDDALSTHRNDKKPIEFVKQFPLSHRDARQARICTGLMPVRYAAYGDAFAVHHTACPATSLPSASNDTWPDKYFPLGRSKTR